MVWGILTTILIVVVGRLVLRPIWFWVSWEILAAGLVALGCAGEWYLFKNPAKRGQAPEHRRRELQFITAVAVGVCMEFFALAHAIPEAIRLEKQVEDIRADNSKLFTIGEKAKESVAQAVEAAETAKAEREKAETGRLELEKQVLALVSKTQTRTINKKTKDALVTNLAGVPKGGIEIVMFDKDPESVAFGLALKRALIGAGFSVTFSPRSIFNLDIIPGIVERGDDLVFCVNNPENPPPYSIQMLQCLKVGGIKANGWPYNKSFSNDFLQIWVCPKQADLPNE